MSTPEFSNDDRNSLRKLLERPVMQRAIALVQSNVWHEQAGRTRMEDSALAYQYSQGAAVAFDKLFALAEMVPESRVAPRRMRPITRKP